MSYEIEYSKKAYKAHSDTYNTDVYFAYATHASNNVDPRTPRPMLVGIGMDWEIIQKVCVLASDCESGCLQPGGQRCKPESYIRRWREVLKNALPLELAPHLRLKLTMKHGALLAYVKNEPAVNTNPEHYRWERITELLKGRPWDVHTWFNEEHASVEFPIRSYEDIKSTIELESHLKEVSLLAWNIQIEGV